jgi:tetratricopeptide (TPR) repeat protein
VTRPASRGHTALAVALAPALVAAAVMAGVVANGFVYDDPMAVELARLPAADLALRRFGLSYLSIHMDRLVWDAWAPGLHATSIALHALASALTALLVLRVSAAPGAALLAGLLFAVHPVHVEAVASIENRKDVLAMVFVATSALLYARPATRWTLPAAIGAWLLALLAKDAAAIGLAAMLPLYDLLLRPPPERAAALRRALPLGAVALLATVAAAGNVVDRFSPDAVANATTGHTRTYAACLRTALASLPTVARLLVAPATLSADYPVHVPASFAEPRVLAGTLMLIGWLAGTIVAARRAPVVAWAMAWVLVMYLPVSNVVPLTQFFVAERYLYVPSFGVCLLAALALDALRRARPAALQAVAIAAAVVLVGAGAIRSVARTRDWRDDLTLWSASVAAIPDASSKAHGQLGLALSNAGRGAESIPHFERALALGPEFADLHNNLGLELVRIGRADLAVPHFRRALELWPGNPLVHFNLGTALLRTGAREEGLAQYRIVLRDETWARIPPVLAAALGSKGQSPAAVRRGLEEWIRRTEPGLTP